MSTTNGDSGMTRDEAKKEMLASFMEWRKAHHAGDKAAAEAAIHRASAAAIEAGVTWNNVEGLQDLSDSVTDALGLPHVDIDKMRAKVEAEFEPTEWWN